MCGHGVKYDHRLERMQSETSVPPRLVLASRSPRRRQLVKALDLPVELAGAGGEEEVPRTGEAPVEFALRASQQKVGEVVHRAPDAFVLGADTVVALNGEILGKPANKGVAVRMLRRLRGRVHSVVTGVTVADGRTGRRLSAARTTDVAMRRYSEDEISAYVDSGEPLDKAGAYGIQDEAFRPALSIVGCYLNVVGLPLCEVVGLLGRMGASVKLRRDARIAERCRDCLLETGAEVIGS